MTTNITSADRAILFSQQQSDAYIALVQFDAPSISISPRFARNAVDVQFGGETYLASSWEVDEPSDDGGLPLVEMRVENITRRWGRALRTYRGPWAATFHIVRSGDLSKALRTYSNFQLVDVEVNEVEIIGQLIVETYDSEPFPGKRADHRIAPALFR